MQNNKQKEFTLELLKTAENLLPEKNFYEELEKENILHLFKVFFLIKYIRTSQAMILLLEKEFEEDAFILSRSLFEIWIKILHMDKYANESKHLYYIQMLRYGLKLVDVIRYLRNGILSDDVVDYMVGEIKNEQEIFAELEKLEKISPQQAQKIKEEFKEKKTKGTLWHGKSTSDMFLEVNKELDIQYKTNYSFSSDLLHSNIGTVIKYYQGFIDETLKMNSSEYNIYLVISGMLISLLESINKSLELKKEKELENLSTNYFMIFKESIDGKMKTSC